MALASKRIFDSVVGHKLAIKKLLMMVAAGRMPNCLLFVGPAHQGKKNVALGLAQALLCETSNEACGQCSSCVRVAAQQSEGVILVEPEKNQIKIDAARNVVQQISLAKWGKARVVIIDDAHLLNPQAANALLKSIEEPPPNTHFVLISASQENILKTLRSRSQIMRFAGLTKQELIKLGRVELDPETEKSASYILECLMSGRENEAIDMVRQTVDSREKGQTMARLWLEEIRNMWLSPNPISRAHLARLSLETLTMDRDLKSNCDLQLTLENYLRQSALLLTQTKVSAYL
ncbi:MAG: hypothetical protein KDD38_05000 [Bdellovibrionales bacterium]|nr:hypothetical protein [Bdellovibrionales bacterium]